ncbi:chemotaxis protein MotB [Jannaschia faecimaris]|uniref:Chemotaxis protein MotB n=1 Tax=Jannaschia faecimaris TaxID=1244108 RepID=A0A1H3PLY2_9RHOB|nr:flagellar motor protein MotB [Jannaschia faecimaris]SDZ02043.1 chemotaxis protein MotB [Jannaschia faecimaris]
MTGKDDNTKRVIIKRKKVFVRTADHGGTWKVAYADFVTAMMAFFMLMWLLNATTDKQRRGLADYFSPSIALSATSGGGEGALGGRAMSADASRIQMGRGGITNSEANGSTEEDGTLKVLEAAIMGKGGDSLVDEELLRHVTVRLTDQGLVIEFFALAGSPLFADGVPTDLMIQLLASVAPEITSVPNALAIEAFAASEPVVARDPRVWPVSQNRADAVRRALPQAGISLDRVVRITGHADRRPVASNPLSARNNRIELVVLRDTVPPRVDGR